MTYTEHRKQLQKEISDFPLFFAFSQQQFNEGLKKLGVSEDDVLSTSVGACIRKRDEQAYIDLQATKCHELAHWTMHKKRLNRKVDFSCSKSIAIEEVIAELSSCVLMKHCDIKGEVKNHEKYIESWMSDLTEKDFCEAVKQSVKVISYILAVEENAEYEKVA